MASHIIYLEETLTTIKDENERIQACEEYVTFLWKMHTEMPNETSLCTVYGGLLALGWMYIDIGATSATKAILKKLEPALYQILLRGEHFQLENIYPTINLMLDLNQYAKAKRLSQHCIDIIMSKNADLTPSARKLLRAKLTQEFLFPIEQRIEWHEKANYFADALDIPEALYDTPLSEHEMERADYAYDVSYWKWCPGTPYEQNN